MNYGQPKGFSTSIWIKGIKWASLPRNLGWLRVIFISILKCDDQRASLPWFEWKVTDGLPYLGTWDDWEVSLSQPWILCNQGASLPWFGWMVTKGLLYLETWGDWEASLSQSWIVLTKGLLYLDLDGRWKFKQCEIHYKRLDPQIKNYQLKLYYKHKVCRKWTQAINIIDKKPKPI